MAAQRVSVRIGSHRKRTRRCVTASFAMEGRVGGGEGREGRTDVHVDGRKEDVRRGGEGRRRLTDGDTTWDVQE